LFIALLSQSLVVSFDFTLGSLSTALTQEQQKKKKREDGSQIVLAPILFSK